MQGNPDSAEITENNPFPPSLPLKVQIAYTFLLVPWQFKSYIGYRKHPLLYLEEFKIAATVGKLQKGEQNLVNRGKKKSKNQFKIFILFNESQENHDLMICLTTFGYHLLVICGLRCTDSESLTKTTALFSRVGQLVTTQSDIS